MVAFITDKSFDSCLQCSTGSPDHRCMDHHRRNKHWRDASRWGSSKRSHSHVTWGTAVERQSISASSYRYRYLGDCGSQRGFDQQPGRTLLLGLNQIALTFYWNSYQRKEEQLWSFFQFLYNTSFVSALPPPPPPSPPPEFCWSLWPGAHLLLVVIATQRLAVA